MCVLVSSAFGTVMRLCKAVTEEPSKLQQQRRHNTEQSSPPTTNYQPPLLTFSVSTPTSLTHSGAR